MNRLVAQGSAKSPRSAANRRPQLAFRALLAAALFAIGSCGAASPSPPVQRQPSPTARAAGGHAGHIAIIVMENKEYGDVIGGSSTPYINGLAKRYGVATASYGIAHPSLPNYLALTGGSTFGRSSDCTDCNVSATSLVDQFNAHHVSWKAYMESMPYACFTGSGSGEYVKRHDPFMYYDRVTGNRASCAHVVPMAKFYSDERRGALPTFIWITPNLCNDMHDCDASTGDRWLSRVVPGLLSALGSHGLLILTWDEGSSNDGCCSRASGGHIATILAGSLVRPRARMSRAVDHYSVLQTVEDLLGLARLRGAACACTPSLQPLLKG